MTLYDATSETLDRLGDLDNTFWSRDEVALYLQDGYDTFCRRTKVLFDTVVIDNLPPSGNWQTDLEKYFIQQNPGWGYTDGPIQFTDKNGSPERDIMGGSYGPQAVGFTNPGQVALAGEEEISTAVIGGYLPQSTVEVLRVVYDNRDLLAMGSQQARRIDPTYETSEGDPQYFTYDKDGLFFLRVVPAAGGDATYDTISGSWGTQTQTDDTDVAVVTTEVSGYNTGGYGILRYRTDLFPSGGTWGTPTRIHPDDMNVKVNVHRLGRSLTTHAMELPTAYQKYVLYWAMSRALRRDGSGQDLSLADHYEQRFEMGVSRLTHKRNHMQPERVGRFGGHGGGVAFGLGDPLLPSAYEYPWSK